MPLPLPDPLVVRTPGQPEHPEDARHGLNPWGVQRNFEMMARLLEQYGFSMPGSGEIRMYGGATAPTGWLLCQGQSLATATYPALFAVIGYTYGGAGANFTLPDLRGRAPIGSGAGAGLTNRTLGAAVGAETHQLTGAESGVNGNGSTTSSGGHTTPSGGGVDHLHVANGGAGQRFVADTAPLGGAGIVTGGGGYGLTNVTGAADRSLNHTHTVSNHTHPLTARSADSAHNNMQPSQAVNFIIKA